MSVNKFIVVLFVSLGIATSAFAASKSRELAVDGNYISTQGPTPTAYLLNASLGQLVTPQLVVVTALTTQKNVATTATTIGIGAKYYFMDGFKGDLVPFAGLGIGLRMADTGAGSNQGSTQYDLNAGLAYFLSDSTTLDTKVKYLTFNDDSRSALWVSFGFSQRF
jgi:outer membrane protein W